MAEERASRFVSGERRPVEVLVFEMAPEHVAQFVAVDHEVWTLGEALSDRTDDIPFLAKEVWVDDARPGRVTIVFVWHDAAGWDAVADPALQAALTAEFDARFPHPYELVDAPHERGAIWRVSRYERAGVAPHAE